MEFTRDDTDETFNGKVSRVIEYNGLVALREEMDSEVEKWGIQDRHADDDVWVHCLHGENEGECEMDERIISMSPCLSKEKFERFADVLHRKSHLGFFAKRLDMNRRYGICSQGEEHACSLMAAIASARRWEDADVARWNGAVEKCRDVPIRIRTDPALSPAEIEYCAENRIDGRYFRETMAILMREFGARGEISRARNRLQEHAFARWRPCTTLSAALN
jgi:hypothetical protein